MPFSSLPVRIATLGGLGRVPFAQGTVATLVTGVPFAYVLGFAQMWLAVFLIVVVILSACVVSQQAEARIGRHDPKEIVIDELAGYLVTMVALPTTATSLFLGFVFFRLFDIWKPWPISAIHMTIRGGAGIVLDDILAGIAANALTRFVLLYWQ